MTRLLAVRGGRFTSLALLVLLVCTLFTSKFARAQESLSVSVTPPLFQLTIGPGESWASTLKIVNNNAYDVTYYTQVVDFEANGEDGSSKFTPLVDETRTDKELSFSLASWIEIADSPIVVAAGSSANVPFTVVVPPNAEPGGHYAAILVGTEPTTEEAPGSRVQISSFVSSLLFVRIKGDVVESGRIREFTTVRELYQNPSADLMLRFENTGTTHLRPQGDITIYNMWGKVRGTLGINQNGNFGNVLPQSIRKFEFSWIGEENVFDIGRYRAVVTLAYGDEGKQNVSAVAYFWVIPLVPVFVTVGVFLLFALTIIWFIRRYIRRALTLERERFAYLRTDEGAVASAHPIGALVEPLREGVIDLRKLTKAQSSPVVADNAGGPAGKEGIDALTYGQFVRKYRLFFAFLVIMLVGGVAAWWYFGNAFKAKRSFQITDVKIQEEIVPR